MDKELLIKVLKIKGELDKYVYLRENEKGERYIEYAFIDGCPENNTCLNWTTKLHPKTLEKYGYNIESWKKRLKKVNEIYYILPCVCDGKNCKVGKPNPKCFCNKDWTYDEPVDCACWSLSDANLENTAFFLTLDEIKKIIE